MLRKFCLLAVSLAFCLSSADAKSKPAQAPAAKAPLDDAATCHALLQMTSLTITSAELNTAMGKQYCNVRGTISGTIRFMMQLPLAADWNGRLVNLGNGGKGGLLIGNGQRVAQGYAVATSNTGHDANAEPNTSFADGNLQAAIDFGYRAVHLTATVSKAVTQAFYKKEPQYTYFEGCSTGGRQGLMEAQRYPDDFDGIVVGAPVFNYQALNMSHVWMLQKLFKDHFAGDLAFDKSGEGVPDSLTKWQILKDAVMAKCDEKDGIKDGIISNPLACDFNPDVDLKKYMCPNDVNGDACYTKRQLQTIKDLYRGPYDSKGRQIIKGLAFGSESEWPTNLIPYKGNHLFPGELNMEVDHVNYLFYEHSPGQPLPVPNDLSQIPDKHATPPQFAWWEFNIDDVTAGKGKFMSAITDATNPDLSQFLKRKKGKLFIYQGWEDGLEHPVLIYDYYKQMVDTTFAGNVNAARENARLFMVPGMAHCAGGPGCSVWDRLEPLVDWVEHGNAPDYVVADHRTKGVVDDQRRICAYPQQAVYVGPEGGQNDRANWVEKNFACR